MLRRPLALIIGDLTPVFLPWDLAAAHSPLLILFLLHHRMLHQRGGVICTSYHEFVVRTIFVHVTREIVANLPNSSSHRYQLPREVTFSLVSCRSAHRSSVREAANFIRRSSGLFTIGLRLERTLKSRKVDFLRDRSNENTREYIISWLILL